MPARPVSTRVVAARVLAGVCAFLAVLTVVVPDWIEVFSSWDPDHGSGAVEVAVVVVLLLAALAAGGYSLVAARRDAEQ